MANTRITQGVIKPNENYLVGILTAQSIDVNGVLTYEDVTSVDSIGIVTARKGIVSLGVVTATAFHGDGSQLTGIDATALKDSSGNVKIQAQASGAVHTGFSTMQNLRVTGIATFGTSSTVINGGTDTISAERSDCSVSIDLRNATLENEVGGGGYISQIGRESLGYTCLLYTSPSPRD